MKNKKLKDIQKWLRHFAKYGLFHPNCRCKVVDGVLIQEPDCCEICREKTISDVK